MKMLNEYTPHINPEELEKKGLIPGQIREALQYINGTETVEGAPHLDTEHYAVFDTANKSGMGTRFIEPMGHVKMMAAVQPFLSGAISKTVNLPGESNRDEIHEIYMQSWKLGLKSIAMYRDGSKGSQPLSTASGSEKDETINKNTEALIAEALKNIVPRGEKLSLPARRKGFNYAATIGGQRIFLRTGEYETGELGEIFIDMFKAGASYKSLLNCFAVAVSLGLQYGVPLEKFVNKFVFTRFDPAGFTDHPQIRNATSVLDFIFRLLAIEHLDRTDLAQVSPTTADDTAYDVAKDLEEKSEIGKIESKGTTVVDDFLSSLDGDAPPCDICGHITVRNGTCYKCLNCGNSMGCS
jgi:ribonucleoside-diphosphate reductase alpha chain